MQKLDEKQFEFTIESVLKEVQYLSGRLSTLEKWLKGFVAPSPNTLSSIDFDPADPIISKAIELIRKSEYASASLLQRKFAIGYARAARILDLLEEQGYVGPAEGAKPRKVYKKKIKK